MTAQMFFATSSDVKFKQYSYIAADHDIFVSRGTVVSNTLTEPQSSSSDIREMSNLVFHPLRLSARFISTAGQVPYFVEDTMLVIDGISNHKDGHIGLPGADTKSWWLNLGAEGILKLLHDLEDRRARYICQIGIYYGAGHYSYHHAEEQGFITLEKRIADSSFQKFPATNPFFFHSIFGLTPAGPTLAELDADSFKLHDYRRACFQKVAVEVHHMKLTEQYESSFEQLGLFE